MSEGEEPKSSSDAPISASRFFSVITGISEWSKVEAQWINANPEWRSHVDNVAAIWKEMESESPERIKIIRHELRRIIGRHKEGPSQGIG
jgi:hypothetical protein